MTENQKEICRYLLDQSYSHGFDGSYPLEPILEKLHLEALLVDLEEDDKSHILYEFGSYGNGMLHFSSGGLYASVGLETRELLAHWCDWRG